MSVWLSRNQDGGRRFVYTVTFAILSAVSLLAVLMAALIGMARS